MAARKSKHADLTKSGIAPVARRRTVQDGVYLQLAGALMTGRFLPGQMLTIDALATLFGTSHMPVREALRRLVAENALELAPNGSALVPAVSKARLLDLCSARKIVETAATRQAVPRLDARQLRQIEALAAAHDAAARDLDIVQMLACNRDFHLHLYQAAGSPVLLQLIDVLWLRFGPYLRLLSDHIEPELAAGRHQAYCDRHAAVLEALRAGDAARAAQEIASDIRGTRSFLLPLCPG